MSEEKLESKEIDETEDSESSAKEITKKWYKEDYLPFLFKHVEDSLNGARKLSE
jgi:hypothetical protein